MDILRPEYNKNLSIKIFLNKIMFGKLKNYNKFFEKNYDKESLKIIKFIKKYIDNDLLLTIQDRVLAPKYKTYNLVDMKKLLKKIGFKDIYRIKKKVEFKNIRRLLAPFYFNYNHEISKALYGDGNISLIIKKK